MSCEATAGEDDEEDEDGMRWRASVAICSKTVALDSSSSRRRRAAWTRRWAAAAYATVSSAFLMMASSRARRATTPVSSGMVATQGREPAVDEQCRG
jgi:hypothetical protein